MTEFSAQADICPELGYLLAAWRTAKGTAAEPVASIAVDTASGGAKRESLDKNIAVDKNTSKIGLRRKAALEAELKQNHSGVAPVRSFNSGGPAFLAKLEKMVREKDFEFLEWEHRTSAQV